MATPNENTIESSSFQQPPAPSQTPRVGKDSSLIQQVITLTNSLLKTNKFYWIIILVMFCIVLLTAITQNNVSFWTKLVYVITTLAVIILSKIALQI